MHFSLKMHVVNLKFHWLEIVFSHTFIARILFCPPQNILIFTFSITPNHLFSLKHGHFTCAFFLFNPTAGKQWMIVLTYLQYLNKQATVTMRNIFYQFAIKVVNYLMDFGFWPGFGHAFTKKSFPQFFAIISDKQNLTKNHVAYWVFKWTHQHYDKNNMRTSTSQLENSLRSCSHIASAFFIFVWNISSMFLFSNNRMAASFDT